MSRLLQSEKYPSSLRLMPSSKIKARRQELLVLGTPVHEAFITPLYWNLNYFPVVKWPLGVIVPSLRWDKFKNWCCKAKSTLLSSLASTPKVCSFLILISLMSWDQYRWEVKMKLCSEVGSFRYHSKLLNNGKTTSLISFIREAESYKTWKSWS